MLSRIILILFGFLCAGFLAVIALADRPFSGTLAFLAVFLAVAAVGCWGAAAFGSDATVKKWMDGF